MSGRCETLKLFFFCIEYICGNRWDCSLNEIYDGIVKNKIFWFFVITEPSSTTLGVSHEQKNGMDSNYLFYFNADRSQKYRK